MQVLLSSFFGLLLSLLMITSVSLAEEKEKVKKEEAKLEEIVVTATRTEKELIYSPASTEVITKKEMEKRHIKTLDDAMNTISGVYIHRPRDVADTPTDAISLRGIPGMRRNLIMLDGIPINDPQGGTIKLGGFRFEDIERVEVVKGPFSSLYGGHAMGGVINIITSMPDKRQIILKTGYGSSFERGESLDDLRKIYLSIGDRISDKFSFFASYGHQAVNGYPTTLVRVSSPPPSNISGAIPTLTPDGTPRWIIGDTGDNSWSDQSFNLRMQYDFTKETKLKIGYYKLMGKSKYDDPHSYLKNASGNTIWQYGMGPTAVAQALFLSGSIEKDIDIYNLAFTTMLKDAKVDLSVGLFNQDKYRFTTPCVGTISGCKTTDFANIQGGPGRYHNTPTERYNVDLQITKPIFTKHLLTIGASYTQTSAKTDELNLSNWKDDSSKLNLLYLTKGKDRIFALYAQDEFAIMDKLTLYLGVRQDWWKTMDGYETIPGEYQKSYPARTQSSLNPKFSFVYTPFEDTILRGSIGKAFRPPLVIELYRRFMTPGSFVYGNPNLKPEKAVSWDIGVEQKLWKGAKGGVTYFDNNLKDLIYSRDTGQKIGFRSVVETVNAAKAETKGVEIELEQRLFDWMRLFSNFTYTDAKIKKNPAKPTTEGKKITGIPEKMFNAGIELEKGLLKFSAIGRYNSKAYGNDENLDRISGVYSSYDSFFVVNTKLTYKVMKNVELSLSIDNLFDKDYYTFYNSPGRSWFTELTMRF